MLALDVPLRDAAGLRQRVRDVAPAFDGAREEGEDYLFCTPLLLYEGSVLAP